MAFKVIVFAALVAVVRGGVVAPVAHVAVSANLANAEYDPHPQYTFAYDVKDAITGDFKSQVESRDGDIVRGQYSVLDADGTKRIVDYVADPINGFNAVVSRAPVAVAARVVAPAPVVAAHHAHVAAPHAHIAAPVVARAPVLAKYAVAPHAHLARHAHLAPAPLAYTAHSHFI